MKIEQLVEQESALIGKIRPIMAEIVNQLRADYVDQQDQQVSIGGNLNQVRSGAVELVDGYTHRGRYGDTWYVTFIKIGTALSKSPSALELTAMYFEELASEAGDRGVTVDWKQGSDVMHFEFNGEKGVALYDYGSAFCWIGFRVQK